MQDHLHLEIALDPDGTAELFATVKAGHFSGHSAAWFSQDELTSFGRVIAEAFPLTGTIEISGGFWSEAAPRKLAEEHVAISFYPIGNVGRVGCHIRLASLQLDGDRPQSKRGVQVELVVTYAELQRFGPALIQLVNGHAKEIVLHADAA